MTALNRAPAVPVVSDNNAVWTVGVGATEALDAPGTGTGLGNRISILHGIDEDAIIATVQVRGVSVAAHQLQFGFCLDSTSALTANSNNSWGFGAADINHVGGFNGYIGTGFHFLQACETATAAGQSGRQN